MKYNQYAYVPTDFDQQITELININFLPKNYQEWTFSNLLAKLVGNIIVEAKTSTAKIIKLDEFAVSTQKNLKEFLAEQPNKIDTEEFYNVALQLLGYHVNYDYDLKDPLSFMKRQALVTVKKINSISELIAAFYRLLNTRTKNGQLLIDIMAGKGYFVNFWPQKKFVFLNGKSLPVFNTNKIIREVVYVATDLDTDQDNNSDLIQVTIFRPEESQEGLKVPALYTASPYFGGIIANETHNHNVDENLSDATSRTNHPYTASPIVKSAKLTNENHASTETAIHKSSYTLNEYLLARGFASVFAGGIGTRGSDGLRITGAPEETESAKAVIEWLHGDRVAYTDRSKKYQIKASWCNGKIGMTGRSYLGTLQIAVATTGVKGLKTVISEAAISSWYDYYREHGLVIAPEECQGEDLDLLAETCQSNLWNAGKMLKIRHNYLAMQKKLLDGADRITGQYSDFWEARNYRHHTNNIKCSWISVHGLNDWNVKPKNVYKLWQKIKQLPIKKHLFLHQGPHYNMNNFVSIDFTDLMNLWLVHELLGIENNAYNQWPTVMIQDNLHSDNWHKEKDWTNDLGKLVTYYPTDDNNLFKNGNGKKKQQFIDYGGQKFKQAKISERNWQYEFISGDSNWANASLRYTTSEFIHPVTILGRPQVKIRVSASRNIGQLSVALVELADRKRLGATPKLLMKNGQELGYRFGTDTLQEFVPDSKITHAKLITKGHMNLQNYQNMKVPNKLKINQFVNLDFKLQPTYYQLPVGSRLVLIIYSTDQAMTKRPIENETYTIDLAKTELKFYQK